MARITSKSVSFAARPVPGERIALLFLLLLLAVGCLALWTIVPALALWGLSKLDISATTHLLLALVVVPAAIALLGSALVWVNGLYLRVSGFPRNEDDTRASGPLEGLVLWSLAIAAAAFVVWLVFFAHDPQLTASVALA